MNSMFLRTNRIKKYVLCISILVLCVTGAMTVMAEENTPIRLDNFTGQTVVVGGTANANKNEIPVLANCIYDTKTHMYTITVDEENDFSIISSVADGMFTNYVVTIETNIPEGLSLFRNGTLMENPDLSGLKQFGHYVLQYEGRKILEFRIVEEYTTLRSFQTPNGFQMVNVTVEVYRLNSSMTVYNSMQKVCMKFPTSAMRRRYCIRLRQLLTELHRFWH